MRRAGRKRDINVDYAKNRPSRATQYVKRGGMVIRQDDVRNVAIAARMKHHGLTPEQAVKDVADTEHGRMLQKGIISKDAHEICEQYFRVRRAFSRAIQGPQPLTGAKLYDDAPGGRAIEDEDEAAKLDRKAMDKWELVMGVMEHRPKAHHALADVVIRNKRLEYGRGNDFRDAITILSKLWSRPLDSGNAIV